MTERLRRFIVVLSMAVLLVGSAWLGNMPTPQVKHSTQITHSQAETESARKALAHLAIKGRAPRTDYSREAFGGEWGIMDGCDMRNLILQRDLEGAEMDEDGCTVLSGTLQDPYTGKTIDFARGTSTSQAIQIDHIVPVSDAWQKGAREWNDEKRSNFYNDPLNLLAVDGPINTQKGDGDAATWLPPHKSYRCLYIARQIAVKNKYALWVTQAEHDAMGRVLDTCPDQVLPLGP